MNKTILRLILIVLAIPCSSRSQEFSSLWQGHFSYNNIVDVVAGNNTIYAAAENAVFNFDPATNEITTITTVDGLSGREITSIYFSNSFIFDCRNSTNCWFFS